MNNYPKYIAYYQRNTILESHNGVIFAFDKQDVIENVEPISNLAQWLFMDARLHHCINLVCCDIKDCEHCECHNEGICGWTELGDKEPLVDFDKRFCIAFEPVNKR